VNPDFLQARRERLPSYRVFRSWNPFSSHCAGISQKRRAEEVNPRMMPRQKPRTRVRMNLTQARDGIGIGSVEFAVCVKWESRR